MSLDLPALLDRVYYRYPSFLDRHRGRARAGRPARGGQERHRQRGVLPGPFSRRAADAGRADDRGADAGGRRAAARPRRRAADRARLAARRGQREVPPAGGAGRSAAARGAARAHAARGWPRRGRRRSSTTSRWRRPSCCSRSSRARRTSIPPRTCIRRRGSARARRSARTARSGRKSSIGARCRIGASVVIDGWTEIGDDTQIFPMASIGLAPQDLKYKGERTRLTIGRGNTFREFVTINRGTLGGGGHTTIGDGNLFMAYVHVAHDCQIGNSTIFGQRRHARRPRHGRGLRHHQRLLRRPPVLPRRPPRLHRRLLGRDQGRAAVRQVGRQPGAHLRPQHASAWRGAGSRRTRSASSSAPTATCCTSKLNTSRALVQIEQDPSAHVARSALPRGVHPQLAARRHPAASRRGAPRSSSPTNEARSDCRQRPVSVPGAGRRARAGARRHDRGGEGRGVSRAERRGRAATVRRFTGSRSASSASASRCCRTAGVTHAVMAGQVKHTKIFCGRDRPRPDCS